MFKEKLCIKRKDIMDRLKERVGETPTNHTYSKFMAVSITTITIHLFTYSFIHSFIRLHIQSLIHLFVHIFIYSFIHSFIYSSIHCINWWLWNNTRVLYFWVFYPLLQNNILALLLCIKPFMVSLMNWQLIFIHSFISLKNKVEFWSYIYMVWSRFRLTHGEALQRLSASFIEEKYWQ